MAAIDGATKSLMQGVSQQVPRERLEGQVSLQTNMLSDAVRGMRRRPGMRFLQSGIWTGVEKNKLFATSVDIGDSSVHILCSTATGDFRVYNESWVLLKNVTLPYMIASDASAIQMAALRGYLYMVNTNVQPVKNVSNVGRLDPDKTGFFWIKAGQYSKQYNVTVSLNGTPFTASYTTPSGTNPGDAALTTPEKIALELYTQLSSLGVVAVLLSSYVYISSASPGITTVATDAGVSSVGVSNASHVALTSDLPARLPAIANGTMCSVGSNPKLSVWYRYDYPTNTWVEAGAYGSCTSMSNMPIRMILDGSMVIDTPEFEGRLAGNDVTNEDPAFLTDGITGMAAFQGRLVLLSKGTVCMSASGKPLRMYRSTVTELLVADPISVFSGSATTANFTHALQFNKDLLLFSKTCQAVVPSGNAVVSPSTAQIVITSSYACTGRVLPVVAGRSLLYFAPRSESFASILEMVPSNTTDSQYTTNDITAHLPRYMPGTIRQATASTTSNSAVFVADGDSRTLLVHEYLWGNEEKLQSAWHNWTAPYDIGCTWFVRDTIYVGMVISGSLCICSVETEAGDTVGGLRRPFSDMFQTVTVTSGTFTVPVNLRGAITAGQAAQLHYATGSMAGEAVGFTIDTDTWIATVVRNVVDGTYMLGLKYRSALVPTPPLIRDQNGVVVGTAGTILIRYEITMQNTGEFHVVVQRNDEVTSDGTFSALYYSSQDLVPDAPTFAKNGRAVVPVRIPPDLSVVTLYTEDDHDLGVLTLEHVMQYHPRRRRA